MQRWQQLSLRSSFLNFTISSMMWLLIFTWDGVLEERWVWDSISLAIKIMHVASMGPTVGLKAGVRQTTCVRYQLKTQDLRTSINDHPNEPKKNPKMKKPIHGADFDVEFHGPWQWRAEKLLSFSFFVVKVDLLEGESMHMRPCLSTIQIAGGDIRVQGKP